jgi:hypothetical protein
MMRNDTTDFGNSAVRFLFGCIAALVNPALVCLQADMRRRPSAGGRSKVIRDGFRPAGKCWAGHRCRPEARAPRYNSAAVGSFIALSGTSKEND